MVVHPIINNHVIHSHASKTVSNRLSASISFPDQLIYKEERYTWRTRLEDNSEQWLGWFKGLSEAFLAVPTNKLLILAERDYLDRPLMIASMQGLFQYEIIRDTGHAIQEEKPKELALLVNRFVARASQVARLNEGLSKNKVGK